MNHVAAAKHEHTQERYTTMASVDTAKEWPEEQTKDEHSDGGFK